MRGTGDRGDARPLSGRRRWLRLGLAGACRGGFGGWLPPSAAIAAPASAALCLAGADTAHAQPRSQPLVVFAAASLKSAFDALLPALRHAAGTDVSISYAASSALARQLEQGAPADVFASADVDWMEWAIERRLVQPATRVDLLGNRLVLIGAADDRRTIQLRDGVDLHGALRGGRLAVADVRVVPAGKYARAALERLGAWRAVERDLAMTENVRAALALVARGEAPLGIVYATDARGEPRVRVIDVFPGDAHPPIIYPLALTAATRHPGASAALAFLRTAPARAVFESEGFEVRVR